MFFPLLKYTLLFFVPLLLYFTRQLNYIHPFIFKKITTNKMWDIPELICKDFYFYTAAWSVVIGGQRSMKAVDLNSQPCVFLCRVKGTCGRMPAVSKNVVFNQSRLMQRCWENKQPSLKPPQLHVSPGFTFSLVVLCQGSALMSCMHSCRECVLPFLLSLLATIAAVKKTNKKEKAPVFAGASKLSRGQNHFEAFMLCRLWQTGIGQILACGIGRAFFCCFLIHQCTPSEYFPPVLQQNISSPKLYLNLIKNHYRQKGFSVVICFTVYLAHLVCPPFVLLWPHKFTCPVCIAAPKSPLNHSITQFITLVSS